MLTVAIISVLVILTSGLPAAEREERQLHELTSISPWWVQCPVHTCPNPPDCPVALQPETYLYEGVTCLGCAYCPTGDTNPVAKRFLTPLDLVNRCPHILCVDVRLLGCEQPINHTFIVNSTHCRGCPHCPANSTDSVAKREETRAILPIRVCPIVECAFPDQNCAEPLQQHSITINGVVCPGCPYCPTSTSAVAKRLLAFPLCPIVDCFFPVNECSQPVKIETIIGIGGHECPGCPYCPDDTTSTTTAAP